MIFGACLMPMALIQGVMGLSVYALAYLRKETLDSWCPGNQDPSRFVYNVEAREMVQSTDEKLFKLSSYYMCSSICPCPEVDKDGTNLKDYFTSIPESELNTFERTTKDDNDLMPFLFLSNTS